LLLRRTGAVAIVRKVGVPTIKEGFEPRARLAIVLWVRVRGVVLEIWNCETVGFRHKLLSLASAVAFSVVAAAALLYAHGWPRTYLDDGPETESK